MLPLHIGIWPCVFKLVIVGIYEYSSVVLDMYICKSDNSYSFVCDIQELAYKQTLHLPCLVSLNMGGLLIRSSANRPA